MPDTSKAVNVKLADGTTVKIEYLKDVISTTHIAREYAKAGYPDKYIVISETQRSTHLTGRKLKEGEFERGVFISCVLRPAFFPSQAGLIGHTTAVALAEALEAHTVKRIGLGWVTDVYCEGEKIGGAAIEGKLNSYSSYEYLIISMAARLDDKNFPPRLADMVKKVFEGSDTTIPMIIAKTILDKFFAAYSSVRNPGKYMDAYKRKFILYGKKIKYIAGERARSYRVYDVDKSSGALIILGKKDEQIEVKSPSTVVMPKRVKID